MSRRDGLLLGLALLGSFLAMPALAGQEEPADRPAPAAEQAKETGIGPLKAEPDEKPATPPLYIWLNSSIDLNSLMQKLRNPDVVLLEWAKYRALLEKAQAMDGAGTADRVAIESVVIEGRLQGEQARLSVALTMHVDEPGEHRVPIRLDGQVLTTIREGDREIRPESGEGGAWFVALSGQGEHRVVATVIVPVKSTPDGSRLELMIPEATSTRLELRTSAAVAEAKLDNQDAVEVMPIEGSEGSLLTAILTPRPKVDLSWRSATAALQQGPALLTAQGGIAIDVAPGGVQVKASYDLRSERGTARNLAFRLDPADELLAVEVDGLPVVADATGGEPDAPITITLPAPIRPGTTRKLTITTRRPLPMGGPSRLSFRGFPLLEVAVQSGLIAVAQSGELWISGTVGRGLRQVDPKTELPPSLRVRPSNVLAYQFLEQPFELDLQVDPSPPWVRVESRTTVSLSARGAQVDTWLDYQVARGRVFEARVEMPEGLELDRFGPDRWVSSAEPLPRNPGSSEVGPRILVIRLQPEAREGGSFQVHLVGRQRFEPSGRVEVPLFRPLGGTLRGGQIAVVAARDVTIATVEDAHVRRAGGEAPADWSWPNDRPDGSLPPIWLDHDSEATALTLKAQVFPRAVQHRTTLTAIVDRRRLDIRQETDCNVHYGTLPQIDVAVPRQLDGKWEIENVEVTRREPLTPDPSGDLRYRLILSRPVTDRLRLRFRSRVELGSALETAKPSRLVIPQIRILEGEASPPTVEVAADAGIQLEPEGPGWSRVAGDESGLSAWSGPPVRLVRSGPGAGEGPATIVATSHTLVALPRLIASRLWLRTSQEAGGAIRVAAWYRIEEHEAEMAVRLPAGAEWDRVRVGDQAVSELEKLPEPSCYRFRFPSRLAAGPVVVTLEYRIPASRVSGTWGLPRLLGGGRVLQTFWEIGVPESRALMGVPEGWNDENEWFWDWYVWKRRPRFSETAMAAWITGSGAEPAGSVPARGADHSYLFSRPGEPQAVRPLIVPRTLLVAGFSGVALGVGLVLLLSRIPGRLLGAVLLAGALTAISAWHPSLLLLGIQSASPGILLAILAVITQRLVERRRPRPAILAESSGLNPPGSSLQVRVSGTPSSEIGSDDSTVVRRRAGTTVEHASPLPAKAKGSSIGPNSK